MGASGLGAYLLSAQALKAKARHARDFTLSIFDVRDIEDFMSDDELLLTNADQLDPSELVLTDADQLEPPVMLLTAEDQLDPSELLLTETDQIDPTTEGELVLTDADRLEVKSPSPQPLVLDDILAELGPGSRVVRLFDPKAMFARVIAPANGLVPALIGTKRSVNLAIAGKGSWTRWRGTAALSK